MGKRSTETLLYCMKSGVETFMNVVLSGKCVVSLRDSCNMCNCITREVPVVERILNSSPTYFSKVPIVGI
jgi:hypothetical protein